MRLLYEQNEAVTGERSMALPSYCQSGVKYSNISQRAEQNDRGKEKGQAGSQLSLRHLKENKRK